ncbi:MAG: hypothetical protein KVP17_004954 [Porospora cf. gigantea B]|uniref:uncharacterized protein n=1 Tax=Porospora cf. gigantea B TaxID=2853592 RepID=UPI003571FBA3|nr:MAG: hypothetical protein KVP17_004954 [Porospora cf. gigantea B]
MRISLDYWDCPRKPLTSAENDFVENMVSRSYTGESWSDLRRGFGSAVQQTVGSACGGVLTATFMAGVVSANENQEEDMAEFYREKGKRGDIVMAVGLNHDSEMTYKPKQHSSFFVPAKITDSKQHFITSKDGKYALGVWNRPYIKVMEDALRTSEANPFGAYNNKYFLFQVYERNEDGLKLIVPDKLPPGYSTTLQLAKRNFGADAKRITALLKGQIPKDLPKFTTTFDPVEANDLVVHDSALFVADGFRSRGSNVVLPRKIEPGKVNTQYTWDKLVINPDIEQQLKATIFSTFKGGKLARSIAKHARGKAQADPSKFILFSGPPGTGKTHTAKILSQSIGTAFVEVNLENMMSKFWGESQTNLLRIFTDSEMLGRLLNVEGNPACLLFVDEIESVLRKRSGDASREHQDQIVTQFLRQLDGVSTETSSFVLVGATNHAGALDAAALSRVSREIYFTLPNRDRRAQVLKETFAIHLPPSDNNVLGESTDGFSLRNIKNMAADAESQRLMEALQAGTKPEDVTGPSLEHYLNAVKNIKSSAEFHSQTAPADDISNLLKKMVGKADTGGVTMAAPAPG